MGCVELMPDCFVVKIGVKSVEEGVIHLDLSSFQALPCPIRTRAADGEVDPVRWNAIPVLVF